jgi:hypothetical protein
MNGTNGAEGGTSNFYSSGGGAGGTIYIIANTITGSGVLSAAGGLSPVDFNSGSNLSGGNGGQGFIGLSSHTSNTYTGVSSGNPGNLTF